MTKKDKKKKGHYVQLEQKQTSTRDADAAAAKHHRQSKAEPPAERSRAWRRVSVRKGRFTLGRHLARAYASQRSIYERIFCCCCRKPDPRLDMYQGNKLKSTRYEWYSFIPQNLFEQLAPWLKPANFYFLVIAVLQTIKEISTTQGRPSILMPLVFVLLVTGLKDLSEDNTRRKQDNEKNKSAYQVFRYGRWELRLAQDILVGDIVKVDEKKRIPADIVLIGSGIANGTHAFIDTKDLDGETNLKPKSVPGAILKAARAQWTDVDLISFDIRCDTPSGDMSEWNAELITYGGDLPEGKARRENLTLDHLVLTDCVLKNTPWLVGMVLYTGDETKIRKNMEATLKNQRIKESTVFKTTKTIFACMAFLQITVCITMGVLAGLTMADMGDGAWYLQFNHGPIFFGFLKVWTWVITCKDFVPISLYVSLEMVQFWQAVFIGWDDQMAYKFFGVKEKFRARAQTSALNEELAQIHYIFSDKTGTLTQNSMDFKKCLIDGKQYGTGTTEAGVVRKVKSEGGDLQTALRAFRAKAKHDKETVEQYPHCDFDQKPELLQQVQLSHSSGGKDKHARDCELFLYSLALNNTVFPKVMAEDGYDPVLLKVDEPDNDVMMQMDASSPDEKALTYFAAYGGFELYARAGGIIKVRVRRPGQPSTFEFFQDVCLIDFSSKRKRMTVIVRRCDKLGNASGPLLFFMKGADSFVKPFLSIKQDEWMSTHAKLLEYGGESLRTLLICTAEKSDLSWWDGKRGFKLKYDTVKANQGPNEKGHVDGNCSSKCLMCVVESEIEKSAGFRLLGATAIEDKLQDGVPGTLSALLAAGIKIWVLTGDNVSTAINIGISCNLLEADMDADGRLFVFDEQHADSVMERIDATERRMHELSSAALAKDQPAPIFGVAMHGDVWKTILADGKGGPGPMMNAFFDMASKCKSVIACRLEPKEKADIVHFMKLRTGKTSLAIGDGNNDTPMIRIADVGVGIRGVEGASAVAAADYAIAQFAFLQRLLLVYGRLNYRRISMLINYMFYKTSLSVWTFIFFGYFSAFSGQFMYLDWVYQLHHVVWTALPVMIYSVLDRDMEPDTLEKYPWVYSFTRGKTLFNGWVFFGWIFHSFLQGACCFFIPWLSWDISTPEIEGQGYGLFEVGLVIYICLIFVTNFRFLFLFKFWTWLHWFSLIGGLVSFCGGVYMLSMSTIWAVGGGDYYGVIQRLIVLPRFWATCLVTIGACFALDLLSVSHSVFCPRAYHVTAEAERLGIPLDAHIEKSEEKQEHKDDDGVHGYTGAAFTFTPIERLDHMLKEQTDLDATALVVNLPKRSASVPSRHVKRV